MIKTIEAEQKERGDTVSEAILVTAKDNPAIKRYRRLAKSKKDRMKEGCFVLEGLRLVTDALRSGAALTHLFWTEEGFARFQNEQPAALDGVRCVLISDALGAMLSQTEHSQGVYAICRMPEQPSLTQLLHSGGIYAVLHQLQDPGNAGMILRTADALGLDGVIYSASCDIYSPKVVRATMGSLFRVRVCCTDSIEPVMAACRHAGVETCAAVVGKEAELVGQCCFQPGTAIVIGNEGSGLPDAVSSACDRRVTIPMHGTIESLNAAMAAGIILWEAKRCNRKEQHDG